MFNTLLVQPLFNLLAIIYAFVPGQDFGVAVIIITILVRLALWPLVKKQLHSQKAIQDLAPEVAKVRERAGGDKQKESQMLMELYKEKEINPFSSFGLLLIQLPLLIAFFVVLRDIVQPEFFARFAYEPVKELTQIKAILADSASFKPTFLGLVDMAKPNIVLAAVAGFAQFLQVRQLQPKRKQEGPNAQVMAVTNVLFPLLTAGIALTLPSALALYWASTSAVAILQQRRVLAHDVEEIEEEAAESGIKVTHKSGSGSVAKKRKKRRK